MKLIDVLEKITKRGKIPHFMVGHSCTEYCIDDDGFVSDIYGNRAEWLIDAEWLNEEVELLEDTPKKIEKIDIRTFPKHNNSLKKTADKLNEVIDYINRGNDE